MKRRLIFAIPATLVFTLLLAYPPLRPAADLLAVVIMLCGLWEFYEMSRYGGNTSFQGWGTIYAGVYLLACAFGNHAHLPVLAAAGMLLLFLRQAAVSDGTRGLPRMALTLLGWGYVVYLGSYFFLMERLEFRGPDGGEYDRTKAPLVLLAIIFSSKLGDAVAYIMGSRFGRHKLIPRISPNKSWEGLFFGFIGNLLPAPAFLMLGLGIHALPLAVLVGLASIFGDLAESMLKRELKVKDMGDYIPGFGGVLDIIDALLFCLPVAYWYLVLTGLARPCG